jgi:hypothetical protein
MDSVGHVALGDYGTCKEFHSDKEVNSISTLSLNEFSYKYT